MKTIQLSDIQLMVLQSILEDHLTNVELGDVDDGTKHNVKFLEELFKQLNKE